MNAETLDLRKDIYYRKEYAGLYADEESTVFEYEYREKDCWLINLAIKRPITRIGGETCPEGFYDLETPYGYGGFCTNSEDRDFISRALDQYRARCREENIIAEFFRFHPFNDFPVRFADVFDLCVHDRDVVVVPLGPSRTERWAACSSSTRNILRKCARTQRFSETDDIDRFMDLYGQTMEKNRADHFYYFTRAYFEQLLRISGVRLCRVELENECPAMGIFMCTDGIAHYHLSANSPSRMKLNANYFLLDEAFEEARGWGAGYFLLGGGRTNAPDDSLLMFKRKFSGETRPFYIAGIVHNRGKYVEYAERWARRNPVAGHIKYFLKYRLCDQPV